MLSTAFRLSLRELPDFFHTSRKAYSPHLIVYWRKQEPSGAVVIIAKQQVSLATKRNALKRKLRAALYNTRPLWHSYQIVALAKASAQTQTLSELQSELIQIFSKMKHD